MYAPPDQGGAARAMESSQDSDDDGLPAIQRLFIDVEDSDSSIDDSDKEWRDSLRVTIETEIQYQVQLRLSRDRPSPKERERVEDVVESEDMPVQRLRLDDKVQNSRGNEAVSVPIMMEDNHCGDDHSSTHLGNELDSERSATDKSGHHNATTTKQQPQTPVIKQSERKNLGAVYSYILNKYGTPHQQLEALMKRGRFRCHHADINSHIGIDKRIRWPLECNIALPTPKFSKHQLAVNFPMQYSGPVLGASRPRQNHHSASVSTTSSLVYDCEAEREDIDMGSGVLQFESRFESGNLRQAHRV